MNFRLPFLAWDLKIERLICYEDTSPHQTVIQRNKYNKTFCIGQNKTGTTSLGQLLSQFGFMPGKQPVGELDTQLGMVTEQRC